MLIYKKGDILKSNCNIICHQVNCQGVMGGGLALQIATRYPNIFEEYKNFCKCNKYNYNKLANDVLISNINKEQYIANCFTQKPNFDTDYKAIKACFTWLYVMAKDDNFTIAIPYKYGCGIANGDWNKVEKILEEIFADYDLYVYEYDGGR